jgi:hypothetical protein
MAPAPSPNNTHVDRSAQSICLDIPSPANTRALSSCSVSIKEAAVTKPYINPVQPAETSKAGQSDMPNSLCTLPAKVGTRSVEAMVLAMTSCMSRTDKPAFSMAFLLASTLMETVVSSVRIYLCLMPVLWTIHSSLVSTICSIILFVTINFGSPSPMPTILTGAINCDLLSQQR